MKTKAGARVFRLDLRDTELAGRDIRNLARRACGFGQTVSVKADHAGPFCQIRDIAVEEIGNVGKEVRKAVKRGIRDGYIAAGGGLAQGDLEAKVSNGGGLFFRALALAVMV